MTKKGNSSKKPRHNVHDEDTDTVSDSIGSVDDEDDSNTEKSWQDKLMEAIDGLTEKRATTRMKNLQDVYDIMSEHYSREVLNKYIDTLSQGLLSCINRGTSDKEVILAMETLTMLTVTLGPQVINAKQQFRVVIENANLSDETLSRARETLLNKCKHGKDSETNQNLRHAALFALAMFSVVEDDSRDLVNGMLQTYESELWKKEKDHGILAQAISSWSIMAASVSSHLKVNVLLPRVKSFLTSIIIEQDDLPLKIACGEALALLYEAAWSESSETPLEEDDEKWLEQMRELTSFTNKTVAKKDRSTQKNSFREFLNTIEEGDNPEINLVVKKTSIAFDSWSLIVQHNAFKNVLGSGLIHHFSDNSYVRSVFQVEEMTFDERNVRKMKKEEKQAMFSKKSSFSKLDTIDKAMRTRSSGNLVVMDNDN